MTQAQIRIRKTAMELLFFFFSEGPIFTAIRWNQQEIIPLLAQRGCELNGLNQEGLTPLAVAAQFQSPSLVKTLLDCDATREVSGVSEEKLNSLTNKDSKSKKPNNAEILSRPLASKNAKRNKKNVRTAESEEISQLFDIVANNQSDQLEKKIADKGFDATVRASYTEETLLHAAVAYGSSECVDLLIKAGCDVNAQTALYNETPLHIAIQEGYFDIFYSLIRNGGDIESDTCEGIFLIFSIL